MESDLNSEGEKDKEVEDDPAKQIPGVHTPERHPVVSVHRQNLLLFPPSLTSLRLFFYPLYKASSPLLARLFLCRHKAEKTKKGEKTPGRISRVFPGEKGRKKTKMALSQVYRQVKQAMRLGRQRLARGLPRTKKRRRDVKPRPGELGRDELKDSQPS